MQESGLKVLMIARDRAVFEPGSAVAERVKEQGKLVEALHVVVLAESRLGLKPFSLAGNIKVYPTNSFSKFFYSSDAARIGKKIVFDEKFVRGRSIITAQDPYECGSAGLSVKKRWRIPLEVQIHADDVLEPYFTGILHKIRNMLAARVIRQADSIRAVHEFMKRALVEKFRVPAERIFVLPVFIDAQAVADTHASFDLHARYGFKFVILMVARLVPQKNIPLALEVIKKLAATNPGAGLVIAGTGPDEDMLKKKVDELGVGAHVIFAGFQSDLASFYKTADVFLQTSTFEGYGMALAEALLSGLPAVSTPVGVALDLASGSEAIIAPPNDAEFIFKTLYDLIENNALREIMRRRGKEAIESRLLSKDAHLARMKAAWEKTAALVKES